MNTTEQHLKRIQDKLQQILKHHALLQKENQTLREELDAARKQAEQYVGNIETLKQQADILKFSAAEMSEEDKKQFEKRINSYVKEINRCIAMLSE